MMAAAPARDEDRPTVAERYTSATDSSNLRMSARTTGDVDVLLAAALAESEDRERRGGRAGWSTLGLLMFRLRKEYAAVRAELEQAEAYAKQREETARRKAMGEGQSDDLSPEEREEEGQALAAVIRRRTKQEILAIRAFTLARMSTLDETKRQLGAWAIVKATERKFMKPDRDVLNIAGRVLDVYLDPLCHVCSGRGFLGGSHRGQKQSICGGRQGCKGTGHRKDSIGNDSSERWFSRMLLAELDQLLTTTAGRIASKLREKPVLE